MSARQVVLALAIVAAMSGAVVVARGAGAGAGAGGGRMATASISGANAAAGRPSQLPSRPVDGNREGRVIYNPYGWYWYSEYDEPEPEPERDPQPAAPPPPPPPPPSVGTTLMALPPGCSTVERGGKFLRNCGGAFYEESFAGDRVVYTVVQ